MCEAGQARVSQVPADTEYPGLTPSGFILPFAGIAPAGLVINIRSGRKQMPMV